MLTNSARAAVFALAIMTPAALHAQRGMGGGGGEGRVGGGANPVAPLIDMRRELNLSARQLVQLDSIERTLLQRNEALRGRVRSRLDSLRPRNRQSSEEEIQRFRAESDSMRALRQVIIRNDSVARSAAMAVLTDSQRVRVRERMAERRGFAQGRMSTMRGQRGFRGGRQGMQGPRMQPRMRQGRPPMDGFGPQGRGGAFGPRFDGRRPMPDDSSSTMRRFRRPPGADVGAGDQGFVPRQRRQPPDSGR